MNTELSEKKWFWGGIALQLGVGYTLGFFTYQIGTLVTTGQVGAGFTGGLIAVTVMVFAVVFLCINKKEKR